MPNMRAKMVIEHVEYGGKGGSDLLTFRAVHKDDYDESGLDENNTFAVFTPAVDLQMHINNPALVGQFKAGQTFYVDFTEIDNA